MGSLIHARRLAEIAGAILLFALYTGASDRLPTGGLPITLNQVAVGASLVGVVLSHVIRRQLPTWDRCIGWMLLYVAAISLSSVVAGEPRSGLTSLMEYAREPVAVLVLINLVTTVAGLRLLTWAFVCGGVVAAAASILQLTTGIDFANLAATQTREILSHQDGPRVAGWVGEPNVFAQLLVPVVPLALYRAWDETSRVLRVAGLAAAVLVGVTITLTYSRAGLVALVVSIGLALVLQRTRPRRLLAVLAMIALVGVTAPWGYWQRMQTLMPLSFAPSVIDDSLLLHAELWRVGGFMFLDHPLLGIGKDRYAYAFAEYAQRVPAVMARSDVQAGRAFGAENIVVRIAAETGLLGVLTWTGALAAAVLRLRSARQCCTRNYRSSSAALLLESIELAVYAYLIASLFQDDSYPRYLSLLLALAVIGSRALTRPEPLHQLVSSRAGEASLSQTPVASVSHNPSAT